MSSTSNVQDLLVNVFRPTYKYQAGTGFVPSLVLSNVSEIIAGKVKTGTLVVSDSNDNTYIGSNAGEGASNTASNVAIGYQAMGGALNSSNNVALGVFSLDGVANSDSNVAVGDETDITGSGFKNILIGPNVTMGDGSYNILIGSDISAGSGSYRFQLGRFLYGDLSLGRLGVNTSAPVTAFDVSGISYFRNKVGIQNPNPDYSLDVNGSLYVSDRLMVGPGTVATPIYGFRDLSSGMYQASDASYGTGAVGLSVNSMARVVVASNKTYIYGNLDVCGTLSAAAGISGGGGGGTIATNGTASVPSFTFSNDLSTGLHLVGGSALGFDTSGRLRMCLSGGFLGIGTAAPKVALEVVGDVSATTYNGPGGTESAPHYTFSDDRTTGIFFPGANMVGFTAGGTERMRISNGYIGIGTTDPQYALDVTGTVKCTSVSTSENSVQSIGGVAFGNATIEVMGSYSLNGTTGNFSNYSGSSNSIGSVTLAPAGISNSGSTSNSIGGVVLNNGAISNALETNNSIGGVVLNNGTVGGVTLSNGEISNALATNNSIGGVALGGSVILAQPEVGTSYIGASYLSESGIGIGTSSGGNQLVLTGDYAIKSDTNTWYISSDRRIKQNIQRADTSLCYDVIKRLPLQRFTIDASYMPTTIDRNCVGWIAQDVSDVFPNAVHRMSNASFSDFHTLNPDQLYKTMYGALEKVIADKEALEAKFIQVLARLSALESASGLSAVDVSGSVMDVSEASPQSSELTPTTPPTPPTPSEPALESPPEPQQPPSSEYAPAPAESEA